MYTFKVQYLTKDQRFEKGLRLSLVLCVDNHFRMVYSMN